MENSVKEGFVEASCLEVGPEGRTRLERQRAGEGAGDRGRDSRGGCEAKRCSPGTECLLGPAVLSTGELT